MCSSSFPNWMKKINISLPPKFDRTALIHTGSRLLPPDWWTLPGREFSLKLSIDINFLLNSMSLVRNPKVSWGSQCDTVGQNEMTYKSHMRHRKGSSKLATIWLALKLPLAVVFHSPFLKQRENFQMPNEKLLYTDFHRKIISQFQ